MLYSQVLCFQSRSLRPPSPSRQQQAVNNNNTHPSNKPCILKKELLSEKPPPQSTVKLRISTSMSFQVYTDTLNPVAIREAGLQQPGGGNAIELQMYASKLPTWQTADSTGIEDQFRLRFFVVTADGSWFGGPVFATRLASPIVSYSYHYTQMSSHSCSNFILSPTGNVHGWQASARPL